VSDAFARLMQHRLPVLLLVFWCLRALIKRQAARSAVRIWPGGIACRLDMWQNWTSRLNIFIRAQQHIRVQSLRR